MPIRFIYVLTLPGQKCQMWLPKVKYPQANTVSTKFNNCLSTDLKWKLHWVILFKRCWIITAYTGMTCLAGQNFWKPGHIFESRVMNSETKFRHMLENCWRVQNTLIQVPDHTFRQIVTTVPSWLHSTANVKSSTKAGSRGVCFSVLWCDSQWEEIIYQLGILADDSKNH